MKIIERDVYEPGIYCPSSGEEVLRPGEFRFNKGAVALKGCWSFSRADRPYINHPGLQEVWDTFFGSYLERNADQPGMKLYEAWIHFLKDYDEDGWVAYELTFHGMGFGPVSYTQFYVVQADTVVEDMHDDDLDVAAGHGENTDEPGSGGEIWRIEPFETAD